MTETQKILNFISPHKQADKDFFLRLIDDETQRAYEDDHIRAVMLALKIIYLNKLKNRIKEAKRERDESNSTLDEGHLVTVLNLNAEISRLTAKLQTFKPFFDEPYFARMDLIDDKEGYNSYYIGKHGDERLEIVDWRAPLARRYYQKSKLSFKINDYDYKLILRRAIMASKGKVIDMKNEYLSVKGYLTEEEAGGKQESLIFDPFLKEILDSRKEQKEVSDIIQTIQEKQYEIITLPAEAQFVAQGVAGSGKTMIMLHRLSYLLYNDEKLRPTDVLVITPSDSFNAFMEELARILELEKVKTRTLDGYFITILKNAGVDIQKKIDYSTPLPNDFLNYVYSEKFPAEVRLKLRKIFDGIHGLVASEECREEIERIKNSLKSQKEEYERIKNASTRVRRCVLGEIKEKPGGGLYYSKQFRNLFNCVSDIAEFLDYLSDERMNNQAFFYRQYISFYKSLRFVRKFSESITTIAQTDLDKLSIDVKKEISDLKRYRVRRDGREEFTYPERIQKREELLEEITKIKTCVAKIYEEFASLNDLSFVLRGDRLAVKLGRCENLYEILKVFYRETIKSVKKRFNIKGKGLCRTDPFALCLLLIELGVPISPVYRYVFVDEGQDISPAEYNILRTANERAAFNIFGDLKQNITPYRGVKSWDELNVKVFDLNLNYRNTNNIVDFVSKNLGIDMQAVGTTGEDVEYIPARSVTSFLSSSGGLTAIICSESNMEEYTRKVYNIVRKSGKISKTKINILTVYESKGLEFSAVAVADEDMTDNEKYIAYTRALKKLAIIIKEQ